MLLKKRLLIFLIHALFVMAMFGCIPSVPDNQADQSGGAAESGADYAEDDIAPPFTGNPVLYSADPVFGRGLGRNWDQAVVDVGAVLYHDGLFHLFYNGTQAYTINRGGSYDVAFQRSSIGYAVSMNGYEWYRMSEEPILTIEGSGFSIFNARASSVVVLDDGTWVMYLYAQNNDSAFPPGAILRATAPAPEGPWQLDATPTLETGSYNEWDDYALRFPTVTKTDDGFVMYYTGVDDRVAYGRSFMIGMATSPDGISWTKYDDPNTGDGGFRASDPVFSVGMIPWAAMSLRTQRVWKDENGWHMLYSASIDYFSSPLVGYATSTDGITWEPVGDEPLLTPEILPNAIGLGFADVLSHDGKYYLYFNATKDESTGDIYLATIE